MIKSRTALILIGMIAAVVPLASPTTAAETTTVTVGNAQVGATILVTGSIDFGTDVTGDMVLGQDPAGDAAVKGVGLDLGNISVRPDIAGKKLIWTLTVTDGLAPLGGPPPMTGYMVPIMVNSEEKWRWLAAGSVGSNFGQQANWTGVCQNETASGTQGGWSCPTMIAGSVASTGITWTQRFAEMSPSIAYGSTIESSSILCAKPCSFGWPAAAVGSITPVDSIASMNAYKVPGEVHLAITPAGVNPSSFPVKATFNGTTSAFSGSLAKPATPGAYTIWAQTCFGDGYEPTCVQGSKDITV